MALQIATISYRFTFAKKSAAAESRQTEERAAAVSAQVGDLKSHIKEQAQLIGGLEEEKSGLAEELAQLTQQLTEEASRVASLQSQNADLCARLEERDERVAFLEASADDLSNTISSSSQQSQQHWI